MDTKLLNIKFVIIVYHLLIVFIKINFSHLHLSIFITYELFSLTFINCSYLDLFVLICIYYLFYFFGIFLIDFHLMIFKLLRLIFKASIYLTICNFIQNLARFFIRTLIILEDLINPPHFYLILLDLYNY